MSDSEEISTEISTETAASDSTETATRASTLVSTGVISDAFGAIDPDEVDSRRHRRWLVPVAGLTVAVVGAAALLAAAPWESDSPRSTAIVLAPVSTEVVAEPTLDPRQILDEVPDGYQPAFLFDNAENQGDRGQQPDTTFALFAAEGTEISDGSWISFEIIELSGAEANTYSASRWIRERGNPQNQSEAVDVNGIEGAFGTDWDGTDILVFGPVDGRSVTIRSNEMPTESVLVYARTLKIVDGVAGLASNEITAALPLLIGSRDTAGYYSYLYGNGIDGASVSYSDDGNTNFISISTTRPIGADPFPVLEFLISDAHETTVHGERAIAGEQDPAIAGGRGVSVVSWIENGRQITVTGAPDIDELVEIAESVRTADTDEWVEMQDASNERQAEMENRDPFRLGTFVVGAGNTSSGSRWRIEANFDDGSLGLCYEGSINSGSGCTGLGEPEFPILQRIGDFGFGFNGVVALVDADTTDTGATDVVLEIEITGQDTLRIPLHDIDESFPGPGAAYAASVEQDYTAELVAADGTVLASIEIAGRGD